MSKRALLIEVLIGLCVSAICGKALVQADGTSMMAVWAEAARPAQVGEPGDEYPRPPKPSRRYRIGVVLPHLSNPHFVGQAYGYLDEARRLGAEVMLFEAGGYQYLDRQISQIEDLVANKVDAIILVAVSGPGTAGAVELAASAGIPVINCNVMTTSNKVVTRVRSDDEEIGRMQADFMGQALKGRGNVVMLRGAPGTSWAENRGNAFRARLAARSPNVKVVGEQYSQSTPADGLRLMEDFMQTHAQIDGVYNGADTTAIGAAQAILASGKKDRIVITTTDFQPDTEKFMREGVITAAVVQQTVVIGRWGVRAAINYLEKRPVAGTLWTPLLLVSRDSLDKVDMRGVRAPEGWKPPANDPQAPAQQHNVRGAHEAVRNPGKTFTDELGLTVPAASIDHPGRVYPASEDFPTGPAIGDRLPDFVLPNQHGESIDFHRDRDGSKAVVVFFRSAVW